MTLHQLRDLLAVVQHGGFRAAARALDVSQAGLTKNIAKFEKECGFELLDRRAKGIVLTERGQGFIHYAQVLVQEAEQAERWIKHQGSIPSESLSVGVSIEPLLRFVHVVIEDYRARLPNVVLRLKQSVASQLLAEVRESKIEFAVTRLPNDFHASDLRVEALCNADSVVVARHGHPCANATSMAQLVDQDWIVLGDQSLPGSTDDSIKDLFLNQGLPSPRIAIVTDSFFGAASMIAASNCLARMPHAMLQHPLTRNKFVGIPVTETVAPNQIAIVSKIAHHWAPEAKTLAAMLKSYTRMSRAIPQ